MDDFKEASERVMAETLRRSIEAFKVASPSDLGDDLIADMASAESKTLHTAVIERLLAEGRKAVDEDVMRFREGTLRKVRQDLDEAEKAARMAEETDGDRPFIISGADLLTGDIDMAWLVRDRIPEHGMGQFVAPSYTGKTLFAVSLAGAVANAQKTWMGHDVDRDGLVLYVAAEGGAAFKQQVHAWVTAHPGTDADRFGVVDEQPVDWSSEASIQRLDFEMESWAAGRDVVLVIFDTQNDVIGDTDENSHKIGQLMNRAKMWARRHGCFALFLHHTPHTDAGRPRGSSSQPGKADVMVTISGEGANVRTATWRKVKGRALPKTADQFYIDTVAGSSGAWARPAAVMGVLASHAKADETWVRDVLDKVGSVTAAGGTVSKKDLLPLVPKGHKSDKLAAIDDLVASGDLLAHPVGNYSDRFTYTLGSDLGSVATSEEATDVPTLGSEVEFQT